MMASVVRAVPNPAAAYAVRLGYKYQPRDDGAVVEVTSGVEFNAWAFFRGKVGSEYAYGEQFGYDTVNRHVEVGEYVQSYAVCVPKGARRLANGAFEGEIALLDLMDQNGEPLWDDRAEAPPAVIRAALDADPLKTFQKQALPSSFDWRNHGGASYIGAIRDQGDCGSCYAFGAAASAEGTYNYAKSLTGANCVDFSESYIAWCLGALPAYNADFYGCAGANYEYAELEALTVQGICAESQFPYQQYAPASCPYTGTTTVFDAWTRVPYGDIAAIKAAIMTYGVVDAAVYAGTAFSNYDSGIYDDSNNSCTDGAYTTSNHAIALVGWDDNPPEGGGGVWILRNSWNTSWGESGYMRLRYDAAVVHCAVCYLQYGPPPDTAPVFNSISSQTATVGVAKVFTVSAIGNPEPVLALKSTTASTGYTFSNTTGVLTYTPPFADIGDRTFTFTASNSIGMVTQAVAVTVKEAPPAAPATLWASETNNTDFTASWSSVSNATSYCIDVGTNDSFSTPGGSGTLISEGFNAGTTPPEGWIFTAVGSTYISEGNYGETAPSLKLDASGEAVQTPGFANASNVSFWIKGNATDAGSALLVESASGGTWSTVTNLTASLPTVGTTISCPLSVSATNLRFTYTKSAGNLAFDDVRVIGTGRLPGYVPGYDSRSVAGTSQSVTGLFSGVTYYFRVRSVGNGGTGVNSMVKNVTTTTVPTPPSFTVIPDQSAAVGVLFSLDVAPYASGSPVPVLSLVSSTAGGGYSFGGGTLSFTSGETGSFSFVFMASNTLGIAAATANVAVVSAPVYIPVASITSIASDSFTVNWTACTGGTNYQLQVATNAEFTAEGSNLMANPGFETGNASDWDTVETPYAVTTTSPHSGVYCMSCVSPSATKDLDQQVAIPIADGTTAYVISYWYRVTAGDGTDVRIWAFWNNGAGSGDYLQPGTYNASVPDWTQIALTNTPAAGATNLDFEVRTYTGATVYFDDFSVAPVGGVGGSLVLDTTVEALTYGVTGLDPETTYYVHVRMPDGVWSEVVSATTTAGVDVPPVLNPIGDKSVTVSNALSFQVTATPTDGDPVTLTASNLPSGAFFYPTNEAGTFVWASASPAGSYNVTFNAADENGSDAETIAITVSASGGGGDCGVIISEYVEGSSNNKALEIFNGTAASIDLLADNYVVMGYQNGGTSAGYTIALTGTVAASETYVLTHSSAGAAVLSAANQVSGSLAFNGNDAVVLRSGGASGPVVDSIGQVGYDPGAGGWGADPANTTDNTLRRKSTITTGDTNPADAFDPAAEWDGYAVDTFDGLGSHTMDCGGAEPVWPDLGSNSMFNVSSRDMILFWDNSGGGTYRIMFATNLLDATPFAEPFGRAVASNLTAGAYTSAVETEAAGTYRIEKE